MIKTQTKCAVRWMIGRDMPQVLRIEQASFDYPWIEDDFLKALRQRNCIGMVAEHHDDVIGYMLYELHVGQIRLVNLAVSPAHRRERIGEQLVTKLIGKLHSHRRASMFADVSEYSLSAHLFFRACGFKATKVIRGLYRDGQEDAFRFEHNGRV